MGIYLVCTLGWTEEQVLVQNNVDPILVVVFCTYCGALN